MAPPVLVLCIPAVAFFFLIQMMLCQAYHFHVTVSRHKRYPGSPEADDQGQTPQGNKGQSPTSKGEMKPRESGNACTAPDGQKRRPKVEFSHSHPSEERNEDEEPPHPLEERLKSRRKSVFAESYDPSKDDDDEKIINPKTPEERKWLIDNLHSITLFQHLANDQVNTVVDAMYKYPVSKGDYIMKQGDKGSVFFMVQRGIYEVYVKDLDDNEKLTHTYNNKGSFGELALLYNQPRAATIIAATDGILWAVDGQTFRRIVHKITYQKRMMYENLINNVMMLRSLEPYERSNLVDALEPATFHHNDEIIKQGTEGNGMYFIISGGVKIVMKTVHDKEILLKELSSGDYFGELALVTDKPRAASAFSVGTTHLAFLDREAFERLLGPCMDIMRRHIDDYNERLSEIMDERRH